MSKRLLFDMFVPCGGDVVFRLFHRAPVVVFYHGVGENPDLQVERESISVTDFHKHIQYLKRYYNVVSINEFEHRFKDNRWEGREVLLTFDDGYSNLLNTALPVLEQYNLPFTVFFTANNITTGELFPTSINRLIILASTLNHLELTSCSISADLTPGNRLDISNQISRILKSKPLPEVNSIVEELKASISEDEMCDLRNRYRSVNPLNWNEAKQVASSSLCTVGSHCLDHICCHENQDYSDVYRQISESKTIIENKLGIPCRYFSYPNGSYTEQSNDIVKDAGYHLGFSTRRSPVRSLTQWNIPRMYAPYDYSRFVYSLVTYPSNG